MHFLFKTFQKGKMWRVYPYAEHDVLIPNSKPIFNIEPPPNSLAVSVQTPGHRYTRQRNEPKEAIPPPEAKSLVHLRASQWQHGAHDATYQRIGREDARRVDREGVYQVRRDAHEDRQVADADQAGPEDRYDVLDPVVRGPAVDEQASRDQGRGVHHGRQAVLGLHLTGGAVGVRLGFGFEDAVRGEADEAEAEQGASAETEIGEADGAGGEAVLAFEDAGEGCEEEVEVAVDDADVDRHG